MLLRHLSTWKFDYTDIFINRILIGSCLKSETTYLVTGLAHKNTMADFESSNKIFWRYSCVSGFTMTGHCPLEVCPVEVTFNCEYFHVFVSR